MRDWDLFIAEVSWFLRPGQVASTGDPRPWDRPPVATLPRLSALLSAATLTAVSVDGQEYELLAWGRADSRRGWLCRPPIPTPSERLAPVHRELAAICGGIVERFGEPDTWWMNQNEVLTESASDTDFARTLSAYSWLWEDEGLTLPLDPSEYYAVAIEANGNLTVTNRIDGRLVLFAPDHAFRGVTPLPGCPPYSLMTIDEAPTLTAWIETCAQGWARD